MSTIATTPRPSAWTVDGLRLAGLAWGPVDGVPVLALHGWMDHADSFKELAPHLTGCHVVAIDLSGQGLSARRADHATYNIWDDLPQIDGLLDQLGWTDCVLLGHSRGAIMGSLYAAARPERVRAFIALDALVPEPRASDFVENLRAFLTETAKQKARPPRVFDTLEDYLARRRAQGNSDVTSAALADRALKEVGGAYHLRGDPRLFAASAVRLSEADADAVLRAITCPVLNIWAEEGIKYKRPKLPALVERAKALVPDYETLDLPGDHHFHLDPDVPRMAEVIEGFLTRL